MLFLVKSFPGSEILTIFAHYSLSNYYLNTFLTMKRKLTTLAVLLATMVMQAQTARQFTINLTDDGQANMVCFLADHPTGRAIVGVPGGGYSMLSNTHEGTQAHEWLNKQGISYFVVNYRLPKGDRTIPIGDVEHGIRRRWYHGILCRWSFSICHLYSLRHSCTSKLHHLVLSCYLNGCS